MKPVRYLLEGAAVTLALSLSSLSVQAEKVTGPV